MDSHGSQPENGAAKRLLRLGALAVWIALSAGCAAVPVEKEGLLSRLYCSGVLPVDSHTAPLNVSLRISDLRSEPHKDLHEGPAKMSARVVLFLLPGLSLFQPACQTTNTELDWEDVELLREKGAESDSTLPVQCCLARLE